MLWSKTIIIRKIKIFFILSNLFPLVKYYFCAVKPGSVYTGSPAESLPLTYLYLEPVLLFLNQHFD